MKIDRAGFMRYNGGALKAAPKERISYMIGIIGAMEICLLYTSPSPRDS